MTIDREYTIEEIISLEKMFWRQNGKQQSVEKTFKNIFMR